MRIRDSFEHQFCHQCSAASNKICIHYNMKVLNQSIDSFNNEVQNK